MLYSANLINKGEVPQGFLLGAGAGTLLLAAMGPKFVKTRSMMPAGMCCILGGIVVAYNGFQARAFM